MLRVGIVAVVRNSDDLHLSTLDQHIYHLIRVLQNTKFCSQVCIVSNSEMPVTDECSWTKNNVLVLSPAQADGALDLYIEVSAALDVRYLRRQQSRGAKVVCGSISHPFFAGLAEPAIFSKSTFVAQPGRYDEIWVHSQYREFIPLLRSWHRTHVKELPLLWTSHFIMQRMAKMQLDKVEYGYKPGSVVSNLKLAVVEYNHSLTRNFMIPMLAADAYERDPEYAGQIKHLYVLSTKAHIEHKTLLSTGLSLDLVQKKRASFDDNVDIPMFMAQHGNAVISHQWYHDQNYVHLELLFGGYPLIHNSPFLHQPQKGIMCGAYYPGFDVKKAKECLAAAVAYHDSDRAQQRAQESYARLVALINPSNPEVIEQYTERLISLSMEHPLK